MDLGVQALAARIGEAHATRRPLRVRGGGTKDFYGEAPGGDTLDVLDTRTLTGAAKHEPTELVVTAPAGMTLDALDAQLAEHGQCLAFDPPHFGAASTVGGMVAAGLSGPARAAAGSVRDHVLGDLDAHRPRRAAALRRPRHQERRRLRRVAPPRRLARQSSA